MTCLFSIRLSYDDRQEDDMPRPKTRQSLIRAAREEGTFTRVEVPRTTCERCHTGQFALPDGEPRPHLRPAVQGDPGWSELVPTMVACEPGPADFTVIPPPDIAEVFAYAVHRDALIDNDRVPVADLPSYDEWQAGRG
jgi:hypothetical protein